MTDFPIVLLEITRPITLYRGCHGSEPATLIEAMRSNYDAGRNPHPAERRAVALYMSLSMFESPEPIQWAARRRPDRVGTHIAPGSNYDLDSGSAERIRAVKGTGRSGGCRTDWPSASSMWQRSSSCAASQPKMARHPLPRRLGISCLALTA